MTPAGLALIGVPANSSGTVDGVATALAADGCAGWSVCIYNPDLDPSRRGADAIASYITQAITAYPGQ